MNTKSATSPKHSMTTRLVRLAAGAALGVAVLTTASPALASLPPEPGPIGVPSTAPPGSTAATDSFDVTSAGLGALAGIAFSGAGLWITLGIQRHRDRSASHSA